MRKSTARFLRKLADFVDPRIKPSDEGAITMRIDADASQALAAIAEVEARLRPLIEVLEKLERIKSA